MPDVAPSRAQPRAADVKPSDPKRPAGAATQGRVTELKVSGHLMTLDAGLFCVVLTAPIVGPGGLPGVRLSRPPGTIGRPDSVEISTFREDGWLGDGEGAALVRIADGPARILVTIYQAPEATPDQAPRLQVLRLTGDAGAAPAQGRPTQAATPEAEVVAHIQRMGDVGVKFGEWMGTRGSRLWIEGFGIAPRETVSASDIEYQAVLGRDWLSPWVEGGKFCGSRGMALPLLGLTVRLKGAAAAANDLFYAATFVDGSAVGPVPAGEPCQAESLAALEAFQIEVRPKGAGRPPVAPPTAAPPRKVGRPKAALPKRTRRS
ncbi:MAG TPA: hypothetical protein VIJ55_14660 [Acetobacteraceae bacterium]